MSLIDGVGDEVTEFFLIATVICIGKSNVTPIITSFVYIIYQKNTKTNLMSVEIIKKRGLDDPIAFESS